MTYLEEPSRSALEEIAFDLDELLGAFTNGPQGIAPGKIFMLMLQVSRSLFTSR